MHSFARAFATAAFSAALAFTAAGCGNGAEWKAAAFAPGYQRPARLSVFVVRPARGAEGVDEAANALGEALVEELGHHGIPAVVVGAPPPPPAANVVLVAWDPGSRAMRYFFPGAGKATALAAVDVARAPDGAWAMHGKVEGWLSGGAWGGDAIDAARAAGKALGKAIATGQTFED